MWPRFCDRCNSIADFVRQSEICSLRSWALPGVWKKRYKVYMYG
jgi:hypothetical protein